MVPYGMAVRTNAVGPPSPLTSEVVRGRLLARLAGRFERAVTMLVAGAGFGKTTLLAQAARQNLTAPLGIDAWVSCRPDEEDPVQFVAACCRAIGRDAAVTGRSGDVIAAVREMSPIDVCLVIDDVHQLAGSEAETVLAEVVPRLPANGHVVFSGRAPVDVPLARLRVMEDCVEIGEQDLAFTPVEERDLARLLDVPPPRRELAGWPALVRLALTSERALTHQFLWEEIVAGLEPSEARALLALALVGWADAQTISSICDEPVDAERLAAKVPLLTVAGDGTLRAHDLWTDSVERLYSRARIAELLPAVCDALQSRHDALRLASIASRLRDPDAIRAAARELVRQTVASLPVRRARTLLAAAAPGDREAPELLLLQAAVAHAVAIDDPVIEPLLARATTAFCATGDEPGEIAALALACVVANSRAAYGDFLRISSRVAELPAARENLVLSVVTELVAATFAELNGDVSGALSAMARLPGRHSNYPMREPAARLHVYLLVLAGRADEAVPIADEVLRSSSYAHIRTTPPFVRWSAGDPSEIETLRADHESAPDTNARDQFFYATLGTYVRASTGDVDELHVLADLLDAMPINHADARDASMLAAAVATRLVAWHDEDGARRVLARHLDRFPIDDPRCDVQLRRALATCYVCAPAVRPAWDEARLGRCHRRMHAAALALLSARRSDGGERQRSEEVADALAAALENTDALITMLPLPLSVELAARAHEVGLSAGLHAIELFRRRLGDNVTAELQWLREQGSDAMRRAAGELLAASGALPMPQVRIEVLGPTRVFIDAAAVENASSRRIRVRQLLALLVVESSLRRDRAMALLWPDLDQQAASRNLRVTLTYLRQVFRDQSAGDSPGGAQPDERFLLVDSSAIRLVAHPGLEVDLWQLDAHLEAAARARAAGDEIAYTGALSGAAALWRGDLLVDLQDLEELSGEVTRVRAALVGANLALGEVRLSEGRAADAARCAQAVLKAYAYNERAHRLAIATQIHLGDHGAASEAAHRMREALSEVGAVPSDTTKILLRRLAIAVAVR
jgi:DNA-binding SARP family transcriptional activator